MKVPFRLHKSDHPGAVTALLLLSEQPAELLELCARIAVEAPAVAREWPALPPIHAVAGGFLVKLGQPVTAVFPGVIRLRSLTANLFLPADAELVPALLSDEAAGLVRERGLIFLPGGRILAFALEPLITADMLLTLPRLPGRKWNALPARPAQPERLESILLDLPDDSADQILEEGGENIGMEAPRPADSSPITRAAGQAALGMGKGLAWLGTMLHWPGLAELGASLAAGAMRAVPRLTESLLGRQEAALRELLRKFRAGDLEEALRHALPLASSSGRGDRPAANAQLPTHRLIYRLIDLLNSAQGPSARWFGPADVQAELSREYHKAAEAATARGDYRRAAFIYGRLLNDYRRAAAVLTRGGLHHDAAILYLEILDDKLAAAQAFEAAGETDRALCLYMLCEKYSLAGDLLRRLGEEEEAVQYYLRAAENFADSDNHLAAADLLFTRAQRPDLAVPYLKAGWARRPRGSAIPCLLRLTQWYAEQDQQQPLLTLVAEAEAYFAPPGNEHAAGQFFNTLARLADHANLSTLRDDLRDRALCGLAGKLRPHVETHARPGAAVSELFGQSGVWKATVVSDADFALKAAFKKKTKPPKQETSITPQRVRFGLGHVSAVCAARASGRVFLGFTNGRIGWFDPHSESQVWIPAPRQESTIVSLATNDRGDRLIALSIESDQRRFLSSFTVSEKGFDSPVRLPVLGSGAGWLTPISEHEEQSIFGYWMGDCLAVLWSQDLLPLERYIQAQPHETAQAALIVPKSYPPTEQVGAVPLVHGCLFSGDSVWCCDVPSQKGMVLRLGWRPCSQLRGLCSPPPLSWHWRPSGPLEFAGVDEDDTIHWTVMDYTMPGTPFLRAGASTPQRGYRAAVLLHSRLIAGVYDHGVDWLRRQQHRLLPSSATLIRLEDAVACAVSLPTRELLVICRNGSVVRVPLPT
jgi:tetratricopeptide (TPR) repeat protein